MGSMRMQTLALSLVVLTVLTTTAAGSENFQVATGGKKNYAQCAPVADFKTCYSFVKPGWTPVWLYPKLLSPCCKYIRQESLDCLCKAAQSKFSFKVDLKKALGLAKKCGKYYPKGTVLKCQGTYNSALR